MRRWYNKDMARESRVGKLSETQCAWLAACLDTDGYISLRIWTNKRPLPKYKTVKNPRSNFRISPYLGISNGDIRLVRRAQIVVNCGSIRARLSKYSKNICFDWEVKDSLNVIPILEQVLPYLIVKRDKAQIILEWAKTRQKNLQVNQKLAYTQEEMDIAFALKGLPSVKRGGETWVRQEEVNNG